MAEGGAAVMNMPTVNAMAVMDDIADKLQLLQYQATFCPAYELSPLSRSFFAVPGKPSEQFPYFSGLVAWCLKEMQVDFIEWSELEDANSVSSSIVFELKKLGFRADFPVSKLRHGSGDEVCLVLDFLVDKLLEYRGFRVENPDYASSAAGGGGGGGVEELDDVDDEDELSGHEYVSDADDSEDEADDGAAVMGSIYSVGGAQGGAPGGPSEQEAAIHGILEAKVDPREWQLELERVGPRLKFKPNTLAKEWRTHLEQGIKHGALLDENTAPTSTKLTRIGDELRRAVERISTKERHINREFEHLASDFREKHGQLESIQEQYDSLSAQVSQLTAELQAKTEAVDLVKAQWQDRNNSMTDTSPIRRISDALAAIKKELTEIELRIGVATQSLLQATMKEARHQGRKQPKKASSDGDEEDSNDSYDDEEEDDEDEEEDDEDEDEGLDESFRGRRGRRSYDLDDDDDDDDDLDDDDLDDDEDYLDDDDDDDDDLDDEDDGYIDDDGGYGRRGYY